MHFQHTGAARGGQGMKVTTHHGLLVAWGQVARWLGLEAALTEHLRIKQKTVVHSPIAKVIEALVGILAGCRFMKDLNHAADPVVHDRAVHRAWGLKALAHFSTVCRTFGALTTENVQQLDAALGGIMAPLLRVRAEAVAGPGRRQPLFIDIDLTGQKVRGEAKLYTGTEFGHIQGTLARGYQIAAAFLSTRKLRLAIAGRLKPGNAAAGPCLMELLPQIEARVGRPRRRVEWLTNAIQALQMQVEQDKARLGTVSGPTAGLQRHALQQRIQQAEQQVAELEQRLAQYQLDNAANPQPFRIVIRTDSAFGTAEVIQHLLELGYDLVVKRYTINAFRQLWDAAPADAWVQVGKKRQASEALPLPPVPLAVSYPLRQVALRRWDANGKEVRSVVVTTLAAAEVPLRDVVACYEARQSIEAGFQEWKGPFHFGHPRLRKLEANAAFMLLVLFAFNLIRWAWLLMQTPSRRLREAGSKMLLAVAARCRATVWFTDRDLRIVFSRGTALTGTEVTLRPPPTDNRY